MVFNQNHASILRFVSSIIIIVGLPTGFYVMFHMLHVIVRTPERGTSVGVRGITGLNETLLNGLRQVKSEERTNDLENFPEMSNHLWGMAKQIPHTVIIHAMIYPHPPLIR